MSSDRPELRVDRSAFSLGWLGEDDMIAYWHSRTIEERWQAIEIMRQIVYGYGPELKMKKVLEILKVGDDGVFPE